MSQEAWSQFAIAAIAKGTDYVAVLDNTESDPALKNKIMLLTTLLNYIKINFGETTIVTDANYTVQLTDREKVLVFAGASAQTITFDSSVNYPRGFRVYFWQLNASGLSITLNSVTAWPNGYDAIGLQRFEFVGVHFNDTNTCLIIRQKDAPLQDEVDANTAAIATKYDPTNLPQTLYNALTSKETPLNDDWLLSADSADNNVIKRIRISSINALISIAISQVFGLQTALDAKQPLNSTLSELANNSSILGTEFSSDGVMAISRIQSNGPAQKIEMRPFGSEFTSIQNPAKWDTVSLTDIPIPSQTDYVSFTPAISDSLGNNFTLSNATAYYRKIGGMIFLDSRADWSSKGSASGALRFALPPGLPVVSLASLRIGFVIAGKNGITYADSLSAYTFNGLTYFILTSSVSGGSETAITAADCANTGHIWVTGFYNTTTSQ